MENCESNSSLSQETLQKLAPSSESKILEIVIQKMRQWDLDSHKTNLQTLKKHVDTQILQIHTQDFPQIDIKSLQSVVHDFLWEHFWICVKIEFFDEDLEFYEKCLQLSDGNVSPRFFGANYDAELLPAIVELSVLESCKTVNEKFKCLCNTFDLIYAQLKLTIVNEIITNNDSETKNKIPVVENNQIIPIVAYVIVKSKIPCFITSLRFIECFEPKTSDSRFILMVFEKSLMFLKNCALGFDEKEHFCKHLDQELFFKFCKTEFLDNQQNSSKTTFQKDEQSRILNQISKSFEEYN